MCSIPHVPLSEKLHESDAAPEPGYEAWKITKINRALDEMNDPSTLVDAEQVWRELGLET